MKPITTILLLAAIICYVFLPFFEISLLEKNITGLAFTTDLLTEYDGAGVRRSVFVLLPFISTFFAIAFNSLKNRYWGVAVTLFILLGIYFFVRVAGFPGIALSHNPEVTSDTELQEGFAVAGLAVGYKVSFALMALSLLSALLSLLPFKFNRVIEESIDNGIEEGKKHLSKMSHDIAHHRDTRPSPPAPRAADDPPAAPPAVPPAAPPAEDHTRFMPH